MNLINSVSIGDVKWVRHTINLKRLTMQVVLYTKLDLNLPQVWLERVNKMELTEYSNTTKSDTGFFNLEKWFCLPFTDNGNFYIFTPLILIYWTFIENTTCKPPPLPQRYTPNDGK